MADGSDAIPPHRQRFPRNSWYIAAAGVEVGEAPLARTINGEAMVLFRTGEGVAALRDACPHKGYPLSEGRVIGDAIRCGYHGIQFGRSGRCVHIPSQSALPSAMQVRAYPVREKGLFIWVWTGDPALADAAAIPEFGFEDRPDFERQLTFSMEVKSNAQFLLENVLDHTHFSYLHAGGFVNDPDEGAGGGGFARGPLPVERGGRTICVWRAFEDMLPTESMTVIFGVPGGRPLKRRLETRAWPSSAYLVTWDRFWDDRGELVSEAIGSGCVTPMDEDHCLHIAAWSSSYAHHPDLKQSIHDIILEDVVAVQKVHRHFCHNGDSAEVTLNADKASILSRRMVADAANRELSRALENG